MKICLLSILLSFATSSFAKAFKLSEKVYTQENNENVFIGESTWNTGGTFNQLEKNGITMSAIEDAYDLCITKNNLCVVKNSDITKSITKNDGRRYLTVKAVVHAVDLYEGLGFLKKADLSVKKKDSWSSGVRFDALKHLGLRYESLSSALNDCYNQGYDFCAILSTEIVESNSWHSNRYNSSATARVRGYKFDL